ncbi:MAG: DNA-directed RNA polymerase subunit beta', partial [Roseimicrobium sp.]
EKAGKIEFRDMMGGVTITKETNQATGNDEIVVIEHKEDMHPQIVIVDPKTKEILASYTIPAGAHLAVKNNEKVDAGTTLAKTPRKASKTKDITGGLPRVAELFEARKPKDACEIAKIDGAIEIGGLVRGKRKVIITDPKTGQQEEHLIPRNKHVFVQNGDIVTKGDQLTEGAVVPHEILEILGPQALREHLVNEVQEVYRAQGVEINDKHVEIIIRQMLRKVKISEPGDTNFLWGDQVDRLAFEQENHRVEEEGGKAATGEPVLLGITKASLETDSFISAASFQDTTRVLTEAATLAKNDLLRGFKENVIMGHLIPAGTGFLANRDFVPKEMVKAVYSTAAAEVDAEVA